MHWNVDWHNPWAVAWNLTATAFALFAAVRLVRTPIDYFQNGARSKFWRILTAVALCISIAGFVIPIGAIWQLNNPPLRRPELS